MTQRTQRTSVCVVFIVTGVAAAACDSSPAIVMYDTDLIAQRALVLHDEQGHELDIVNAFDVDGDVLVAGRRIFGEECESGISNSLLGPWPYRNCYDIAHGFVARVGRDDGEVKWQLASKGSEDASCSVEVMQVPDARGIRGDYRVLASCEDGVELDGVSGAIDMLLDVDEGALLDEPAGESSWLYDALVPLDDGSVVATLFETTYRGFLNDGGVIDERVWENAGEGAFAFRAEMHVLGDEVRVAWQDGMNNQTMRFAVLALADGRELESNVVDAGSAWPSANGWWSKSPYDFNEGSGGTALQHRDASGAVTAELDDDASSYVLEGTHEELWVHRASGDGGAASTVVVEIR